MTIMDETQRAEADQAMADAFTTTIQAIAAARGNQAPDGLVDKWTQGGGRLQATWRDHLNLQTCLRITQESEGYAIEAWTQDFTADIGSARVFARTTKPDLVETVAGLIGLLP
jgi:hypothetical protein